MTLQELFNSVIDFVNNHPVQAIMYLVGVLEMVARNIKSDRNLSIIQNAIKYLTLLASILDKVVTNKTATPNVVYTTKVNVAKVEVKETIS